jgi:hypothetical protein
MVDGTVDEKNPYDYRLIEIKKRIPKAWEFILQKRRKSNHWTVQHKHPGIVHFIPQGINSFTPESILVNHSYLSDPDG